MKKLILLGLATLITFSASAQIEMYMETKVENPTLTQEQVNEMILSRVLVNRDPYFFGYLQKSAYLVKDVNIIGDTLYSLPSVEGCYYCLSTNKSEDTLKIVKFPYGEYFYVKNILYGSSLKKIFAKFDEMVYLCDRIEDSSLKKGYFEIPKITRENPNSSEKKPIWQWLFTDHNDYGQSDKVVYVLENKGMTYYITKERSSLYPKNQYQPIFTPELADFISVKSYNFFKEKYVGKEVYSHNTWTGKRVRFKEELQLYKVEKILVKDGRLYGEFRSIATNKIKLSPIDEVMKISIKAESNIIEELVNFAKSDQSNAMGTVMQMMKNESKLASDTIYCIHGYNYSNEDNGHYSLKSEVDSLLAKWAYEEEQIALAKKKQQDQYKAEILNKYGEKFGNLVIEGKVCLGMSKEMCLEALGYPCKENSSETALGKIDIWTYDCILYNAGYIPNLTHITFTNGKISGITKLSE